MNAAEIRAALGNERGEICRCPLADEHTNGDADPSFSVRDKGGGVLVHCLSRHANDKDRIIDALKARRLWPSHASNGNGKPAAGAKAKDAWLPLARIPKDAPEVNPNFHLAKFGVTDCELFEYRGDAGELLYCVGRFDKPDKSKEFIPYTYCQHRTSGKRGWRTQGRMCSPSIIESIWPNTPSCPCCSWRASERPTQRQNCWEVATS